MMRREPKVSHLISRELVDDAALRNALRHLRRALSNYAKKITEELDLQEDLIQEGMILLWEKDPTRFRLSDSVDRRFLLRAARNRMRDAWDKEIRRRWDAEAVAYRLEKAQVPTGRTGYRSVA